MNKITQQISICTGAQIMKLFFSLLEQARYSAGYSKVVDNDPLPYGVIVLQVIVQDLISYLRS